MSAFLRSIDIPQAYRPEAIRALVRAVKAGFSSKEELGVHAELTDRHVDYYLQAARILGFLELKPQLGLLPLGEQLVGASDGTSEAIAVFRDAIVACRDLAAVVGDFLKDGSDRTTLTERIVKGSELSLATANHRAGCLMAWRQYVASVSSPRTSPASTLVATRGSPVTAKAAFTSAPSPVSDQTFQLIENQMRRGKLVLMTGSGFSCGAKDAAGRPLPTGPALAREIWDLAFPSKVFEKESTLGDIFAVASKHKRAALSRLLVERLSADPMRIPDYYRLWFSLPWRKIYTLNIDNLDLALATRFRLPRRLVPVSAVPGSSRTNDTRGIDEVRVVHLNGCLAEGLDLITFSPPQYGRRHNEEDPAYTELANEMLAYSFVFVGTPLDESMLWAHIELREARLSTEAKEFRPRSFLISPALSLARQGLLEQYKITWIQSTAEEFAVNLLSTLTTAASEGLEALRREHNLSSDLPSNVRAVSELVANPPSHRTEYLLGEHPHWSDLTKDRAVVRASDDEILELCHRSLKNRSADDVAPIVVVSGTGGAGKSTSLMRVALRLSAEGHAVGWVGTDTEASPRTIGEVAESDSFSILAIDDLDRYGSTLPSMLRRVCSAKPVRLLVGALRASRVEVTMDDPVLREIRVAEHPIPHLTDADIDRLLSVLDKEHRLGKLKGLSRDEQRAKFREHAGRQILVAMIEATSGKRFEEKVLLEWQDLPTRHRMVYAMIAVAGALGIPVSKSELLLGAGRSRGIDDVAALTALAERRIVTCDPDANLYRPRHRVIAETLLDELRKAGQELTGVIEGLAFAVSSSVAPDMPQRARPRRLIKILLNNEYLFRNVGFEAGRRVYEAVEENLHWDHHFWLQRGVLELHEGTVAFAEHCLDQARSLPHSDPLVDTAYAHMLFRKAAANPGAADASRWVADAVDTLRSQIDVRGMRDPYPYDVLGRQAIQWAGRAPWPVDQRKAFLEEARRLVRKGLVALPRHHELAKLEQDILRSILSL